MNMRLEEVGLNKDGSLTRVTQIEAGWRATVLTAVHSAPFAPCDHDGILF